MNNLLQKYESHINSLKNGSSEETNHIFTNDYLDQYDKYGLKPIHWACMSFNVDILKLLLEKKCDIETASRTGWRPIHFATYYGDENMIKFLIEKYCKVDCKTDNGETVLDLAVGNFNHEIIDEILMKTNTRIGLSMGLKCGRYCLHKFCLKSLIRCDFSKEKLIAQGISGFIYEVENLENNWKFAVKTFSNYNLSVKSKLILPNINEILPTLEHSKIIKYYGVVETVTNELNVFMELMIKGTLNDEINSSNVIIMNNIGRYCRDILKAVAFLHQNKILHNNINARQIFIDKNGGCKLAISISSCLLRDDNDKLNSLFWTPIYQAPEIITDKSWSFPFDIWSVACTTVHILTGISRFLLMDVLDMVNKIKGNYSEMFQKFLESMIIEDPIQRATANVLLKHKFFIEIPCYYEEDSNSTQFINQSLIDGSLINRNDCIDIIQNSVDNNNIGLSMGLKCGTNCDHRFCLSSVTAFNFEKGEKIDKGAVGKVYKMPGISEKQWAVKIIKIIDYASMKNETRCFENDINQYREIIKHNNIVKYFGAVKNMERIGIFMEFIDGGSLYQKMNQNRFAPLPLKTIKQYTKQILQGLKYLHDNKIIHRDIKSQNMLITQEDIIKIADFGFSRILRSISLQQKKSFCGTPNYVAPEIIKGEPYDWSADIWSLGATVFEMASGHPPYHETEAMTVIFIIGNTRKIEYPSYFGCDLLSFLNLMVTADPKSRYSARDLIACDFLKE